MSVLRVHVQCSSDSSDIQVLPASQATHHNQLQVSGMHASE